MLKSHIRKYIDTRNNHNSYVFGFGEQATADSSYQDYRTHAATPAGLGNRKRFS